MNATRLSWRGSLSKMVVSKINAQKTSLLCSKAWERAVWSLARKSLLNHTSERSKRLEEAGFIFSLKIVT
jgi:hypothetical protein